MFKNLHIKTKRMQYFYIQTNPNITRTTYHLEALRDWKIKPEVV